MSCIAGAVVLPKGSFRGLFKGLKMALEGSCKGLGTLQRPWDPAKVFRRLFKGIQKAFERLLNTFLKDLASKNVFKDLGNAF